MTFDNVSQQKDDSSVASTKHSCKNMDIGGQDYMQEYRKCYNQIAKVDLKQYLRKGIKLRTGNNE